MNKAFYELLNKDSYLLSIIFVLKFTKPILVLRNVKTVSTTANCLHLADTIVNKVCRRIQMQASIFLNYVSTRFLSCKICATKVFSYHVKLKLNIRSVTKTFEQEFNHGVYGPRGKEDLYDILNSKLQRGFYLTL